MSISPQFSSLMYKEEHGTGNHRVLELALDNPTSRKNYGVVRMTTTVKGVGDPYTEVAHSPKLSAFLKWFEHVKAEDRISIFQGLNMKTVLNGKTILAARQEMITLLKELPINGWISDESRTRMIETFKKSIKYRRVSGLDSGKQKNTRIIFRFDANG